MMMLLFLLLMLGKQVGEEGGDALASGSEGRRVVLCGCGHGCAMSGFVGDSFYASGVRGDGKRVPGVVEAVGEEDVGSLEFECAVFGLRPFGVGAHVGDAEDVVAEVDSVHGHISKEYRGCRVSDLEEAEFSALLEVPRAVDVAEGKVLDGRQEGLVCKGRAWLRVGCIVQSHVRTRPTLHRVRTRGHVLTRDVQLVAGRILPLRGRRQKLRNRPLEHERILYFEGLARIEVTRELSAALGGRKLRLNRRHRLLRRTHASTPSHVLKVVKELREVRFGDDRTRGSDTTNHEMRVFQPEPRAQRT